MARAAPAASRAVDILAFLTAHSSRGFTISELVQHLDMNIASAHATLAVLCDAGFILRDPSHKTYVLGPALAATGFAALEQHPAVAAALEQAEILASELDAEIGVSAIAGRDVIFLGRRGPAPTEMAIGYPGDRSPLLAPIGAVFMAWANDDAIDAWLNRAQVSVTTGQVLRQVLYETRLRGFSVPLKSIESPAIATAMRNVRSEPTDEAAEHALTGALQHSDEMLLLFEGLRPLDEILFKTIAVPVFDDVGRVILSISLTGPNEPTPLDDIMRLGRRLIQSATIATLEGRGRAPRLDDASLKRDPAGALVV